jgi:diguanylate cyclase (GGDEF)-like protein
VSTDSSSRASFAENAAREIAQLEALVAAARSRLAAINQDVVDAEGRLGDNQSVQIVEANEQLVLAAMRSHADADTAALALEDMSRMARLDALTGLPNRVVLLDRLAHAIPHAKRRQARLAVLFLDLNNFEQINDTLGHSVGDRVLKQVADRLAAAVREGDTVSRLGGAEFVFLLSEVIQTADAALVADKLISVLAAPIGLDEHVIRLTASIGITLFPDDGEEATILLDRANSAMYRAKDDGMQSVVFYAEGVETARHLNPPVLASMQRPLIRYELALAEHERSNEVLREANQQLVVAALSAQDLHAAAQEAQRRQSHFLAKVAHELRNPLGPIRNAVALMAKGPDVQTTPRMRAVIERQVVHLARLVDDLVDMSRVGTEKLRIQRERVDIVDIIDAAIDVSRPAMDKRLQALIVQVPSCALHLQGDFVRLTQVLNNLLDNASKYTPEGGEIRLSVDKGDDVILIKVADSGIGISADVLPQVFEPFVQDPHAIAFNGGGLGIGLTVVRELVEAHGGTVAARSGGPGQGSCFVVELSLDKDRGSPASAT